MTKNLFNMVSFSYICSLPLKWTILHTFNKQVATILSNFMKKGLWSFRKVTIYFKVYSLRYFIFKGILGIRTESYLEIYAGLSGLIIGLDAYVIIFKGLFIIFEVWCVLLDGFSFVWVLTRKCLPFNSSLFFCNILSSREILWSNNSLSLSGLFKIPCELYNDGTRYLLPIDILDSTIFLGDVSLSSEFWLYSFSMFFSNCAFFRWMYLRRLLISSFYTFSIGDLEVYLVYVKRVLLRIGRYKFLALIFYICFYEVRWP